MVAVAQKCHAGALRLFFHSVALTFEIAQNSTQLDVPAGGLGGGTIFVGDGVAVIDGIAPSFQV